MTKEEISRIKKDIEYFSLYPDTLEKMTPEEIRETLSIASSSILEKQDILLRQEACEVMYRCCFRMELDIKEIWNVYWILSRNIFIDSKLKISEKLEELYKHIFKRVKLFVRDKYEKIQDVSSNLVILITSQFLGLGHAPTRRILDYAYAIAKELNKRVMIINDSGLNYYPYDYLKTDFRMNFLTQLNNYTAIQYRDLKMAFYQIEAYMPDIYCINEILRKIYQLKPNLVYSIGDSSLVADLCTSFTKTACFPCSTDIPITMSKYLLVGRKIKEIEKEKLQALEPYQEVIETLVNYELSEPTKEYSREEFGISEEDFVLGIVGNRLDIELDNEFLQIINNTLEELDIHYIIIGKIYNIDRIKEAFQKKENLHFTGLLEQASQAIKLCDIYCNAKRKGGGRSSFEALANGVPVITLKYGDVYYTCGEEFSVKNYEQYIEQIRNYYNNSSLLKRMKQKALSRAAKLSNIRETQRKALQKIL